MFSDLLKDIRGTFGNAAGTRTITVAKPYCTPARDCITGAMRQYGVKIIKYRETTNTVPWPGGQLPTLQVAEVTVSAKAAAWAEYLLLRTGKFRMYGPYQDKRNETWAVKHAGQMPPPWQEGKPWIESSCSAGKEAWRNAKIESRKKR